MSVKINLGNRLSTYENSINDAYNKINELKNNLYLKENELKEFKDRNLEFEKKFEIFEIDKKNFQDENRILSKQINDKTLINHKLEKIILHLENKEKEFINTIKILKNEIEHLNMQNNTNNENLHKYIQEIEFSEKLRSKYELQIVELTNTNNELLEKIKTYDSVLKQKEKYINILIKKNESSNFKQPINSVQNLSSNLNTIETKDTNYNKELEKSKKKLCINNHITNIVILQNKMIEFEDKLKEKDEIIKKLEIEKSNLLVRIRNIK